MTYTVKLFDEEGQLFDETTVTSDRLEDAIRIAEGFYKTCIGCEVRLYYPTGEGHPQGGQCCHYAFISKEV